MKPYKRSVNNKLRVLGVTDTSKRTIKINKTRNKKAGRGELIDTIAHEEMHAKHPRMHEKTIRRKTPKAVKRMKKNTKQKMYKRYSK